MKRTTETEPRVCCEERRFSPGFALPPNRHSLTPHPLARSSSPRCSSLKKLQKEGEAGRRKFQQYQRYGALGFAVVQAVGQCLYVRPFVEDFNLGWLVESSAVLTAGAMILLYIGEVLTELRATARRCSSSLTSFLRFPARLARHCLRLPRRAMPPGASRVLWFFLTTSASSTCRRLRGRSR